LQLRRGGLDPVGLLNLISRGLVMSGLSLVWKSSANDSGNQSPSTPCPAIGMDLDELLHFLEARDKVRIKSGVVYPGGSPACEH
jgi:hypothetical protein